MSCSGASRTWRRACLYPFDLCLHVFCPHIGWLYRLEKCAHCVTTQRALRDKGNWFSYEERVQTKNLEVMA
eukprot:scaffold233079_cov17-Prasinocladus_malaysianus.AAC.1